MAQPFLSIVVPTLNEQAGIGRLIDTMRSEVTGRVPSWEIVIADDGSTDGTRAIVERRAREDARIRLIAGPHRGKGAALRRGLLGARGTWRFMADADLSMPSTNVWRFITPAQNGGPLEILIGSREAPGSQRIGEPWRRHALGRVFNALVQGMVLPGIQDTQCGYKLLPAQAVERIVPLLTVDGFAFDVELLVAARRLGFPVREVGIEWYAREESRVALRRGGEAFIDLLRIRRRWRHGPAPGPAG